MRRSRKQRRQQSRIQFCCNYLHTSYRVRFAVISTHPHTRKHSQLIHACAQLTTEIKIHRSLSHKHVVGFYGFFEDRENVYILLELCSNKVCCHVQCTHHSHSHTHTFSHTPTYTHTLTHTHTLKIYSHSTHTHTQSLMELQKKRRALTEPEVRYYMLQIIDACKYMHEHKVIHRDLKLGNLFLDENMHIKVGDFGLATTVQYDGERKKCVGCMEDSIVLFCLVDYGMLPPGFCFCSLLLFFGL